MHITSQAINIETQAAAKKEAAEKGNAEGKTAAEKAAAEKEDAEEKARIAEKKEDK